MKCKIGFYTRKIEKHTKQQKYTFANTLHENVTYRQKFIDHVI